MFDNSVRPARVVLVNDRGEIVLDSMIRVEDSMMVMVKPGKKTAILEDAKARGPSPDLVRKKVLELIAGKKLVGYGLKAKLLELGIYSRIPIQELEGYVNCATMFNKDGKKDPQHALKDLCKNHLNLQYSNKKLFSVSENFSYKFSSMRQGFAWLSILRRSTKISMAISHQSFHRLWLLIQLSQL